MVKKVCDVCGKVFDVWDEKQDFHIEHAICYGSKFDGETLSLDLCNDCLDKVLDYIHSIKGGCAEEAEEDEEFLGIGVGGSTNEDDEDLVWKPKNTWPRKWS